MRMLVDGDIVVMSACFSGAGDYLKSVEAVDYSMDKMCNICNSKDYTVYLTGRNNFRKQISKTYKANRTKEKPYQFKAIRDYMVDFYNAEVVDEIEADDAMAINQSTDTVICSTDKDMKTVHGWNLNFRTGELIFIDEETAFKNLCIQLLVGDSVDNIPGLKNPSKAHHSKPPNFSQATAEEYLKDHTVEDIKQLYIDQYGNEGAFKEISTLLFIRRKDFTDFETFYQNYRLKTV